MNTLRTSLIALLLAATGAARAESLAESDQKYNATREKLEFDGLAQEEAAFAAYRRRLDALLAAHQKSGDLHGVLSVQEEIRRLGTERSAPAVPDPAPANPLAREGAQFAASLAKARTASAEQIGKLNASYLRYLDTQMKESTKAGKFEEASAYLKRMTALKLEQPAAPAPVTVAPAPTMATRPAGATPPAPVAVPVKEDAGSRLKRFLRDSRLSLRRPDSMNKDRDLGELVWVESPEGFRPTAPKNPYVLHKLLLGGPLGVGDEVRVVSKGVYSLEFVSDADATDSLYAPPPTRSAFCEVVFRRTAAGYELLVDGRTKAALHAFGRAKEASAEFLAGDLRAAVTFYDEMDVHVRSVDVKKR